MSEFRHWLQWNESQTFERKSCYDKRPGPVTLLPPEAVSREIAATLCAMANADGGVLLVGQENRRDGAEDGPGKVTGVDYKEKSLALLRDVPRRLLAPPLEDVEVKEEWEADKRLLTFQVRSAAIPCRLTDGRSLLRVGTHNVPYSEQAITLLKQSQSPYERRAVAGATLADLDSEALKWFAERIGWTGDRAEMLRGYHLLQHGQLNHAALLLFARDPRQWHDHPDVTVVRYAGRERGLGERYRSDPPRRLERPLVRLVEEVYGGLRDQLRRRVELHDLFFQEQLEYPSLAWQEAVVNAIAHRDYLLTGAGIEIWLFDDRLEVRSPGAPPPPITLEELRSGQGAHYSRNPLIVRVPTDSGYMREQGEGIPRMFEAMEAADLQPPELTIENVRFVVTLRNTPIYNPETARWLRQFAELELTRDQKRLLAMASARGGRFTSRDVQKQFHVDLYTASTLIKTLIRKGIVRLPEKGGRVYEVLEPTEVASVPPEIAILLPAFDSEAWLTRAVLEQLWAVPPHQARRMARALAGAGWLTVTGTTKDRRYGLGDRARIRTPTGPL
ncbi:MAG: ATP-binding protein [Actinomycetota bacterium]